VPDLNQDQFPQGSNFFTGETWNNVRHSVVHAHTSEDPRGGNVKALCGAKLNSELTNVRGKPIPARLEEDEYDWKSNEISCRKCASKVRKMRGSK
jgi:hypothetical protein